MPPVAPILAIALTLPGSNQATEVALKRVDQGHVRVLYQDDLLDGIDCLVWLILV